MVRWLGLVLLQLVLAWPLALAAQSAPAWQPWQSPAAMARLDAEVVSVERSSFCSEGCRYDRHGRGAEAPASNPRPDRWLYRDGTDFVIYDDPGAGVLSRIWLTSGGPQPACLNPAIHLKLYFGGASTPQVDMPLAQVFDGSTAPFQPPLVFDKDLGSGGYASYVPIAYSNGLRVALTNLDQPGSCSGGQPPLLWYQLDAQHLAPGSVSADFSVSDTFPDLQAFLAAEGDDPWQRGLPGVATNASLVPAGQLSLASGIGSGWIAGIRLKLDPSVWPHVRLHIAVDSQMTVSMPLSEAFAVAAADTLPARSPMFGLDASGWLYLWWPMPYRHYYSVWLVADGLGHSTAVQARVVVDPAPVAASAGLLHGASRQQCSAGVDHEVSLLEVSGSGRLMALGGRFGAADGTDARYLEGDVRLLMDQRPGNAWHGSGLEDFYNGGFYFDWGRAYRNPWSGAGEVNVHGVSHMWRLLLGDAPMFANGLQVRQEAGASPSEAITLCADTVAWWYQAPRSLVPVATVEVGDGADRSRHGWQLPPAASCAPLTSHFADAGASARSAAVCRYASGHAQFHLRLFNPSQVLRLRRVVDAAQPGQAARIEVNGVTAGWFPPVRPDGVRRWQVQDAPLAVPPGTTQLDIAIWPLWGQHGDAGSFSTSRYQLWATPGDIIFRNGLDPGSGP